MKKILILYSEAGGGHKSNAMAIANKMKKDYPGEVEIELFNPLVTHRALQTVVEKGYIKVVTRYRFLWNTFYYLTKTELVGKSMYQVMQRVNYETLAQKIKDTRPDLIVNTYYFGGLAQQIVNDLGMKTEVFTIITDPWGFHPVWLQGETHNIITFSEDAYRQATTMYPAQKVKQFDPIINEKYDTEMTPEEKAAFAKEIGIDLSRKTILLTGGGLGLAKGDQIFDKLLHYIKEKKKDWQVIMVCGNNELLQQKCLKVKEQYQTKSLVYGFVTNMYELVNIADLLITKAGPATLLEAIKLKKKIIVTDYIWEQEKYNVDFIEKHECGMYLNSVDDLYTIFDQLDGTGTQMSVRNGLHDIVNYIINKPAM